LILETEVQRDAVLAALDSVRDPELDEPITDLGFVQEVTIDGANVFVRLRLPTSFCAPNFSYLMASDAMDAVRALPGVGNVSVVLDGNVDSERINAGVAASLGFAGTFPEETASGLEDLRFIFQSKAHLASIERVCVGLMRDDGLTVDALGALTLADLPHNKATDALFLRRADLKLSLEMDSPVLVDEHGTPWESMSLATQLRFAKATRISIDGNAHFCRGMLRTRYPDSENEQSPREQDFLTIRPLENAS